MTDQSSWTLTDTSRDEQGTTIRAYVQSTTQTKGTVEFTLHPGMSEVFDPDKRLADPNAPNNGARFREAWPYPEVNIQIEATLPKRSGDVELETYRRIDPSGRHHVRPEYQKEKGQWASQYGSDFDHFTDAEERFINVAVDGLCHWLNDTPEGQELGADLRKECAAYGKQQALSKVDGLREALARAAKAAEAWVDHCELEAWDN